MDASPSSRGGVGGVVWGGEYMVYLHRTYFPVLGVVVGRDGASWLLSRTQIVAGQN